MSELVDITQCCAIGDDEWTVCMPNNAQLMACETGVAMSNVFHMFDKAMYAINNLWYGDEQKVFDRKVDTAREIIADLKYSFEEQCIVLPVDADGKPVHVGDVMEDADGEKFTVSSIDYGIHENGECWMLWSTDGDFFERAVECRHDPKTVKDVLNEFVEEYDNWKEYSGEMTMAPDMDKIMNKYAKRLRLVDE